jgi:chemotaxis protein CheD
VSDDPEAVLTCLGLGSCVSFIAHDPVRGSGGVTHCVLPDSSEGRQDGRRGRYVDTALPALIEKLSSIGSDVSRLNIAIVGGARMLKSPHALEMDVIGERNVRAARAALERCGLHLQRASIGGRRGRTVRLFVRTGRVEVKTVSGPTIVLMGSERNGS